MKKTFLRTFTLLLAFVFAVGFVGTATAQDEPSSAPSSKPASDKDEPSSQPTSSKKDDGKKGKEEPTSQPSSSPK